MHQSKVQENLERLASQVESSNLNLVDIEASLDFAYTNYLSSGILRQTLQLGAVGTFGDNDKTMHAYFLSAKLYQ